MLFSQILLLLGPASFVMASPTTPNSEPAANEARGTAATRNIMMFVNHPYAEPTEKYLNVPVGYDTQSIRHADYTGMFWTFSNGNRWLTLNDKRLFLLPAKEEDPTQFGPENEEDWPIMSPDELRQTLASSDWIPSLQELEGRFKKISSKLDANPDFWNGTESEGSLTVRDKVFCEAVLCRGSGDCYMSSDNSGDCYRCDRRSCTWRPSRELPNYIGEPGGGSRGRIEIKREEGEAVMDK